ncbi:MAG: hypothetical protein MUF87_09755 [Anaerolineae bacterium]|jgi:hypothetical protein|nr:hypothetical protein [Anaerolineae bacterium]
MNARLENLLLGRSPSRGEVILDLCAVIVGVIFMIIIGMRAEVTWNALQWIVALILAADLVGGAVVNATEAAKRQYHGPEARPRDHLLFNAGHAIHLTLLAVVFGVDASVLLIFYLYLWLATAMIVWSPHYLQRPIAFLLLVIAILIQQALSFFPIAWAWLIPVLYLKLLVGHLLNGEAVGKR